MPRHVPIRFILPVIRHQLLLCSPWSMLACDAGMLLVYCVQVFCCSLLIIASIIFLGNVRICFFDVSLSTVMFPNKLFLCQLFSGARLCQEVYWFGDPIDCWEFYLYRFTIFEGQQEKKLPELSAKMKWFIQFYHVLTSLDVSGDLQIFWHIYYY